MHQLYLLETQAKEGYSTFNFHKGDGFSSRSYILALMYIFFWDASCSESQQLRKQHTFVSLL